MWEWGLLNDIFFLFIFCFLLLLLCKVEEDESGWGGRRMSLKGIFCDDG